MLIFERASAVGKALIEVIVAARRPARPMFAVSPAVARSIAVEKAYFDAALIAGTVEAKYRPITDVDLILLPLRATLAREHRKAAGDADLERVGEIDDPDTQSTTADFGITS